MLTRRHALLASTAMLLATPSPRAVIFQDGMGLPWRPFAGNPREAVKSGENRNGPLVDACLTRANGHAERIAALHMIEPRADRAQAIVCSADKAYDAEDFVNELRSMKASPHIAQNTNGRSSAIDGRTTRHAGSAVSQRIRKRIEEAFGWMKTIGAQEKTKFRGCDRVGWAFTFTAAAYNLARLPKLLEACA
jgi:Transposase DDE domain